MNITLESLRLRCRTLDSSSTPTKSGRPFGKRVNKRTLICHSLFVMYKSRLTANVYSCRAFCCHDMRVKDAYLGEKTVRNGWMRRRDSNPASLLNFRGLSNSTTATAARSRRGVRRSLVSQKKDAFFGGPRKLIVTTIYYIIRSYYLLVSTCQTEVDQTAS